MYKEPKDPLWMFGNYMEFFEKFDMNKQNITSVFFEWKTDNQGGVKEYLWDIFEKLLYESQQIQNDVTRYKVQLLVYKEMWNYKVNVKGENGNEYYQKYLYCGLRLYEIYNITRVRIVSGNCCSFCNTFNEQRISIEDAIKNEYLASKNCLHELCCNCLYLS